MGVTSGAKFGGRWVVVAAALALAFCWQATTVSVNYDGNWTALFCTGGNWETPAELADEQIYTFAGSNGFDGQFYHYMAHEVVPGELSRYVDDNQLRYRRVLLPGMAYLFGMGRHGWIDAAYIASGFLFLVLGIWWMAAIAMDAGLSAAWGALFMFVPASLIFLDRMTIDHALVAFCIGFAYYARRKPGWQLYLVLMLAPLAKEMGVLLIFSYCCWCAWRREWRTALIFATSGIPAAIWFLYLAATIGVSGYPNTWVPLQSLLHYMLNPVDYPADVPFVRVVQFADSMAHFGMLVTVVLAAVLLVKRRLDPVLISMGLFTLLTVFLQRWDNWVSVYGFGRIYSPMVGLVVAAWLPVDRRWALVPLALITPRVVIEYGRQIEGVMLAVFGVGLGS
jgi:hypothetical protein